MELILTHEQADFDAVAAMLGAYLLNPDATPVLPRRCNRNVRAYLTLYGGELPFVEPDDLSRAKVERVTLVDTQSLTTVKGMGSPSSTIVHIVDHHPLARDLPESWTASIDETGAATTLLVEHLREREPHLTVSQATLLLLGIYEDTGSLSYVATQPRDVLAVAWLLERGASLAVANDFLHHPLTPGQHKLYERLLAAAETHTFDGQTVVVACAQAEEMEEEISTLAHKLRDLFEPDALFLLVKLESHVQLVARSTSDAIDVAEIAAAFGGGGHDRAAAATIRDLTLEQAHTKLLQLASEIAQPRATVAEIMSQGAHTLPPHLTVAEADEIMRRYGYEGFPVVANSGAVAGLLTRRAVDRALAHQMGATPIREVMEAGQVSVRPDDSVERLQRLMTTHGWGQVPVVDPESGAVIGIVTRTDLIKILPDSRERRGPRHVTDLLESRLSPERLALLRQMGEAAAEMKFSIYIVGGFVRDLLLDKPVVDFDLVVEGNAIELARALARRHGGRVRGHSRFGTAKWMLNEEGRRKEEEGSATEASQSLHLPSSLDLVSARIEYYPHPTALPEVERGSIKLDLHRRDFTINTLAVRLNPDHFGDLLDFWGGERDLRERLVRVLHSLSFVDDPTRILRAVRLEQRLAFRLEARTQELVEHALPLLDRVSSERVRHELDLILAEAEPEHMLGRLSALGVLPHIHPALAWDEWLERKFADARRLPQALRDGLDGGQSPAEAAPEAGLPAAALLYYGALVYRLDPAALDALLERLKPSRRMADHLHEVIDLRARLAGSKVPEQPSRIVALFENYQPPALAAVWVASDDPAARSAIEEYLARLRWVAPTVDGETLKGLGLKPGPRFKEILAELRNAWLDGRVTDAAGEKTLLSTLLEDKGREERDKLTG